MGLAIQASQQLHAAPAIPGPVPLVGLAIQASQQLHAAPSIPGPVPLMGLAMQASQGPLRPDHRRMWPGLFSRCHLS